MHPGLQTGGFSSSSLTTSYCSNYTGGTSSNDAVLVLAEWDRCTRSLMDSIEIMRRIHERGAFIKVLDRSGLDLSTPTGRGILALLSGLAKEERRRILRRANGGRCRHQARHQTGAQAQARRPSTTPSRRPSQSRRKLPPDRQDLPGPPCNYR
jgi:DNA invertase Pin-like site-specific DNA recombinase